MTNSISKSQIKINSRVRTTTTMLAKTHPKIQKTFYSTGFNLDNHIEEIIQNANNHRTNLAIETKKPKNSKELHIYILPIAIIPTIQKVNLIDFHNELEKINFKNLKEKKVKITLHIVKNSRVGRTGLINNNKESRKLNTKELDSIILSLQKEIQDTLNFKTLPPQYIRSRNTWLKKFITNRDIQEPFSNETCLDPDLYQYYLDVYLTKIQVPFTYNINAKITPVQKSSLFPENSYYINFNPELLHSNKTSIPDTDE